MTNASPYACYGQDIRVGEIIKLTREQVWLSCLLRSDIDTLAKTSAMHFAWDHRWMIDQAIIAACSALPSLVGSSWQAGPSGLRSESCWNCAVAITTKLV